MKNISFKQKKFPFVGGPSKCFRIVRFLFVDFFVRQFLILAPYTNKSDVWSYGVTAWEIYSKADVPYAHIQHNFQVIEAIKRGEKRLKSSFLNWSFFLEFQANV